MFYRLISRAAAIASATLLGVCLGLSWGANANTTAPRATLQAFKNEQEIRDLFKRWAEEQQRRDEARSAARLQSAMGMLSEAPSAAAPALAKKDESDSVTNVQHAGGIRPSKAMAFFRATCWCILVV